MIFPATCLHCRRKFDLEIETADPARRCQYCGGELSYGQAGTSVRHPPASCPICGSVIGPVTTTPIVCSRCGTELLEPEPGGRSLRVAPHVLPANRPPLSLPCPHCGARIEVPVDKPKPEAWCKACGLLTTPKFLPLEAWADVKGLAEPGTLAENLVLIFRGRWKEGRVSAAEVFRQIEGIRHVMQWLQTKAEERRPDFPLPPALAAEVLKFFILRSAEAEIYPENDGRVKLVVPAPKQESEQVAPALIVSVVSNPAGSAFEFLARTGDGTTAPLPDEAAQGVRATITTAAPRATFRFLACRALFGEWIRPRTMAAVPAVILERELGALHLPADRIGPLVERLTG